SYRQLSAPQPGVAEWRNHAFSENCGCGADGSKFKVPASMSSSSHFPPQNAGSPPVHLQPALSAPNFCPMLKSSARSAIRLRAVRHNNLKNFDLDLPLNQLIVVTGLSGSGKSSLAFDTLFAEGQRRYIETFSPYARQFLDRMDKPKVDHIE